MVGCCGTISASPIAGRDIWRRSCAADDAPDGAADCVACVADGGSGLTSSRWEVEWGLRPERERTITLGGGVLRQPAISAAAAAAVSPIIESDTVARTRASFIRRFSFD